MTETEQEAARFWANVDRGEGDGCWVWQAAAKRGGYGSFRLNGQMMSAHRAAHILTHGSIPKGMVVRHRCSHPPCVRPDHLLAGTYRENSLDEVDKRREAKGLLPLTNEERAIAPKSARTKSGSRLDLHLDATEMRYLAEIKAARYDSKTTDTLRALIREEAARAARQARRAGE